MAFSGVNPTADETHAFAGQFRACYVDDAVALEAHGLQRDLIIETRYRPDEGVELFTIYNEVRVRATTLNDLVSKLDGIDEIQIPRKVPIDFGERVVVGRFTEHYRPSRSGNAFAETVKATLQVDTNVWESPWSDFLGDALVELHQLSPAWRFRTCMTCALAAQPSPYGNTDREFWCYRDSPEAIREYEQTGRFSDGPYRFTGNYWVPAFHRCAAWRLREHQTSQPA